MEQYSKVLDTATNILIPGSRFTVSKMIEAAVKRVLENKYGPNWKEQESLFCDCYESLRKSFRKESYSGDIPYLYSMYYMLLNIPKIQLVLLQLLKRKRLPPHLKVLDVGSGVGTSAIALIDLVALLDNLCGLYGENAIFQWVGIDTIEAAADNIDVFNKNVAAFKEELGKIYNADKIEVSSTTQADITDYRVDGNYDLIIVSNMLNEIPYESRKDLILRLQCNLNSHGDMIIIEPASKGAAIGLNRLKSEIAAVSKLTCLGPCGPCEKCRQCWVFQTCDISECELVGYVDELYQSRHPSHYTDDFYNNRLKWNYCILSRSASVDQCTDLAQAYIESAHAVQVNIVSNRVGNNRYLICDGKTNRGHLIGNGHDFGYFKFGDLVTLENIEIVKTAEDLYRISVTPETRTVNKYSDSDKSKTVFKEVKERNITYILNRLWGYESLREGQFEIIKRALQGTNILGILPTGAGKSICFQMPAMLANGSSIVISPLKSLMKDQIANLRDTGFEFVDYIDSSKSPEEKRKTFERFKAGNIKLLYVSPERIQMLDFQLELQELLKNFSIDYFIVDEAHCASEWGHDFRPSYLKLIDVASSIKSSNVIAVTATASPKVKEDILRIFRIEEENVIYADSLDRSEISFEVINLPMEQGKDDCLIQALAKDIPRVLHNDNPDQLHQDGSGIIFTIYADPKGNNTERYGTEHIREVAAKTCGTARLYHSKLKDSARDQVQDDFKRNRFPVLVSTKGFGMGIDKPNIRYIVHMCYSNSLEAYYQEAGRAGRDRQHSHSLIISRTRIPECIQNQTTIDSYEPPCINGWHCYFTLDDKCDYGMQAKFISDMYPDPPKMKFQLKGFYCRLRQKVNVENANHFEIAVAEKEAIQKQTFLYHFQMCGVIKDFVVLRYRDKGMEIRVFANPQKFVDIDIDAVIEKIVERLQNFKKQKYNMLQSMWEYVNNNSKCRRQFLMDYFQDSVNYGPQGCCFCDVEGISEERSVYAIKNDSSDRLFAELNRLMNANEFDYKRNKTLLTSLYQRDEQESAKIRAMKHLEDFIDSPAALYFRCVITLKKDKSDAYARNQINELIAKRLQVEDVKSAIGILNDVTDIDESLTETILLRNEEWITRNGEIADGLARGLSNSSAREIVYKAYVDSRINAITKSIKGRKFA